MSERTKVLLDEEDIPQAWYNLSADMPESASSAGWNAVLHPTTGEAVTPDFLEQVFPRRLVEEASSTERWVEIPRPVRDIYRQWRPTPLIRARRLERALETPAHIYYKYEGVSPVGSHKPNTAVPQAFYASEEGAAGCITETGAGQWGSALAMACRFFDIECHVYMVRVSYFQKPYRRFLMESYGATVLPTPSDTTDYGRRLLEEDPDHPGSLGIAASEVMEAAAASGGRLKNAIGSLMGPVLMHQSVIGLEALKQFEKAQEYPDVVIACNGAGSNFGGFAFPFLHRKLEEGLDTRLVAVEPSACPSLIRGEYTLDHIDTARKHPLVKMHTLGGDFVPAGIHAGGLRYHGSSPQVSALYDQGLIEALAVPQLATFEAALTFAGAEGLLPAPESAHAIRTAIDEALRCRESGEREVIAFNLSGHGHYDLTAYDAYLKGELEDYEYAGERVAASGH